MFNTIMKRWTLVTMLFLFILPTICVAQNDDLTYAKGLVIEAKTMKTPAEDVDFMMNNVETPDFFEEQIVKVKILNNQDKGKIITTTTDLRQNPFDIRVKKGDKVFLYGNKFDGETEYYIRDFWHLDSLLFWIGCVFVIVIMLGGKQGVKSLLTLGLSIVIIFSLYVPAVQNGFNSLVISIVIALLVNIVTLPFLYGFSKKALISIIGTVGGIFVAVAFATLIDHFSNFNGLGTEDMRLFAANNPILDYNGIFFSGIIIGALGAVMDVSVSISSGLEEIKQHKPNINLKELVISGMNIGKDIMGSMLNTLIFAYIGTSIAIVLIFSQNNISIMEFLNYGFVAEEIIRSIIGSIGLLATIPITALSAGIVHKITEKQ